MHNHERVIWFALEIGHAKYIMGGVLNRCTIKFTADGFNRYTTGGLFKAEIHHRRPFAAHTLDGHRTRRGMLACPTKGYHESHRGRGVPRLKNTRVPGYDTRVFHCPPGTRFHFSAPGYLGWGTPLPFDTRRPLRPCASPALRTLYPYLRATHEQQHTPTSFTA